MGRIKECIKRVRETIKNFDCDCYEASVINGLITELNEIENLANEIGTNNSKSKEASEAIRNILY